MSCIFSARKKNNCFRKTTKFFCQVKFLLFSPCLFITYYLSIRLNLAMEIETYARRWFILGCFTGQILAIRMLMNSTGVVNNVYKAYFNIPYFVIDWFTLIQTPGRIISTIVLAILIFNSKMKFRLLFVIVSSSAVLLCVCFMISFAFPQFYGLIFVGEAVIGFGFQAADPIISRFATNWFPEDQIGFAMSFKLMGICFGCLLAFFVPSQLFRLPPIHLKSTSLSSTYNDNISARHFSRWHEDVYWKSLSLYGVLLFVCLALGITTFTSAADLPPKPPTLAQARKRQHLNGQKTIMSNMSLIKSIKLFLTESKSIMFNAVFFQAVIMQSISYH